MPYELMSAERQKAALDYFGRQVFDAPLWLYPAEITSKTGVDATTEIAKMQAVALNATFSLNLLNAIYNNSQASPRLIVWKTTSTTCSPRCGHLSMPRKS